MTRVFRSRSPKDARRRRGDRAEPIPSAPDDAASDTHEAEVGGPDGPEPTRYGDWERRGICVDF